jgi:hypothetical protein
MNKSILTSAAACAVLLAALPACQKSAEAPQEVASDVADAQADRSEAVLAAEQDQSEVYGDTASAAVSSDPDKRGEAIEDRAEARYDTSVSEAKGDRKVTKESCEALSGEAQAACKRNADATYDATKADAKNALEAERERGEQTEKLDNK